MTRASDVAELTVGVDVGGTKILAVLLDGDAAVVAETRRPTPPRDGRAVIDAIADAVHDLKAPPGTPVGAGLPGLVDGSGVLRIGPNLPGVVDLDLGRTLATRIGDAPVIVDNDGTCAAIGEWVAGAAIGATDAVIITLGTGIGSGIISNGAVVHGANGFAGEVGHFVVDRSGPVCPCGKRGCWERYASGSGLAALGAAAAAAGGAPGVLALAGGDAAAVRGEHVTDAAAAGDPGAATVLDEFGWWIALGLGNLAETLDPRLFVLGGGLAESGALLIDRVRGSFAEHLAGARYRPPVAIEIAALGERSGAIGAAVLARPPRTF